MDYELANQLKDAGFPLYDGRDVGMDRETVCGYGEPQCLVLPTLEELIEACGRMFWALHKYDDKFLAVGCDTVNTHKEHGRTPKEAVARLWLELPSRSNITSSHAQSS